MGVARLKHGQLKSVTLNDRRGEVIERYEAGVIIDNRPPSIHVPREPLPEPTFAEEIGHAGTALAKWIAAGIPIATPEVRAIRYEICLRCEYWSNRARFGMGKCRHPGCGCTRLKLKFATERCPAGKWEAVG